MTEIKLPDFDDFNDLADIIGDLTIEIGQLENTIKHTEAQIVLDAVSNREHWIDKKPPAISFILASWKVTGFDNELLEFRQELATKLGELERYKRRFSIYHDLVEIYRTESANRRNSLV